MNKKDRFAFICNSYIQSWMRKNTPDLYELLHKAWELREDTIKKGYVAWCETIPTNTTLRHLSISSEIFELETQTGALTKALEHNFYMEEIQVWWRSNDPENLKDSLFKWIRRNGKVDIMNVLFFHQEPPTNNKKRKRKQSIPVIHGPSFEQHYLFDLNVMKIVFGYYSN